MTARILIVRSQPGAEDTRRRLEDLGLAALCEPVFTLEAMDAAIPEFNALAFTSLNGVRRLAELSAEREAPVYCVGRRTAEEAQRRGYMTIACADGNVDDLLALIMSKSPKDALILHAGHEESRGDLCGRLNAAGWRCAFRALYRAAPVKHPGPILAGHLSGNDPVDAVMIHSPRAGSIIADFLAQARPLSGLRVVAISRAAGAPLEGLAEAIAYAPTPDEPAMIDALRALLGTSAVRR